MTYKDGFFIAFIAIILGILGYSVYQKIQPPEVAPVPQYAKMVKISSQEKDIILEIDQAIMVITPGPYRVRLNYPLMHNGQKYVFLASRKNGMSLCTEDNVCMLVQIKKGVDP